jgi:hypothetical protein
VVFSSDITNLPGGYHGEGFNAAASFLEHRAIQLGKAASPDHTVKAVAIVEQLRTATLGKPDKPKHLV